jgi:hypothetical protein
MTAAIIVSGLLMFVLFVIALVPAFIEAYKDHPTLDRWGRRKK